MRRDYDQARDDCPDCRCLEAELVDISSAGRFWGYRGLRPVLAIRQVTPAMGIAAGSVLRPWYRLQRHKRKRLMVHNRGFLVVNAGPAVASQLARYLNGLVAPHEWMAAPG